MEHKPFVDDLPIRIVIFFIAMIVYQRVTIYHPSEMNGIAHLHQ